ncbi:GNAT family N-acetyltransferase [Lysobacter auxotrophicus]|uniref:GNAT family N-acetyltransferase n=1 Tax=Lysobacter auxotrophicus TaxID=2992573 RepID=A0ABM8DCM6_9GAMM|nr:GNAT family N-acetyltransferase [Lysobacter auxotrophicus]BDU16279.1 GNAT family N-acetyltransferase [Lysobacter auxotrophicus]
MSRADAVFHVEAVAFEQAAAELRAVRDAVFVQEQGVPVEIERDALDPLSRHVLARDADGRPIGTGRLTPDRRIGRMAVLPQWRNRRVGEALLKALLAQAQALRWNEVTLHAQVKAMAFYARQGFLPYGGRFVEAGLDHQSMRLVLGGVNPVLRRDAGLAALLGVIDGARRQLLVYSRDLDPGLLDTPEAMAALRRFAVGGGEVRVLLHDPEAPRRALAPLIGLSQRLPSAFAFRAVEEPVDRDYASAYVVGDRGGWYFRTLGHRFDGETRLDDEARARQLRAHFAPVWERARPCTEYRALGI